MTCVPPRCLSSGCGWYLSCSRWIYRSAKTIFDWARDSSDSCGFLAFVRWDLVSRGWLGLLTLYVPGSEFALAHELGHHCLHRKVFNEMSSADEIMCRDAGEKPIAERQADLFAAYLLMPKNQVMKAFTKVFGDDDTVFEMDFKKRYMLGSIAKRVIDSGSFSNVSLTAMTNRLIGMGLITGISYQKSVMPEGINNGIPAYLTRLYRRLKKLIK